MDGLVEGALEESAVDGADGTEASGGHTGREKDCVLFCDADVVELFGDFFC